MTTYEICVFFGIIFEGLVAWKYFDSLFKQKRSNLVTALVISVLHVILFLAFNATNIIENITIFSIINFIIGYFLYQTGLQKAIFHMSMITCFMLGAEILSLTLLGFVFDNVNSYASDLVIGAVFIIINRFIYWLILQFLIKVFSGKKDVYKTKTRLSWFLWVNPCATFLMYYTFSSILLTVELPIFTQNILLFTCLAFLFSNVFIFTFYHYNQELNRKYTVSQMQLQKEKTDKEFYKILDEQNENQRILIHDIKKHLDVLKTMTDKDVTKNYIAEIEDSPALQEHINFSDNHTLNLILIRFFDLFNKNNISSSFCIESKALDFMEDSDITSLFSNLLENAYEATLNIDNAFIDLYVRYDNNDANVKINMVNTYNKEPNEISKGIFKTTKEDKRLHGYGLKSIEKVVKKYNGISNFYTKTNEKNFHVNIYFMNTI